MESDEIQSVIEEQTSGQMASDEVKIQISNAVESQIQNLINEAMSSDEVQKKLAAAEEGAKTVIALKASLDNYNAFYLGVLAYTGAVDQAAAGARDVTSGSEDLAAGAAALSEGCCELSEKLFEFSEGAETIRDGSSDLKDGISRFDKEAVKRMSDFVNKDLSDYSDKLRAVTNIGRKYRNGYPLSNGSDGRYRYVFKSDSF
jgi:putative membrane protein